MSINVAGGVNIGEEKARELGRLAAEKGIVLSVHAPYYISLASAEEIKRKNSVRYILESARAVDWMGGDRIVVHPGGLAKITREDATALACETLREAVQTLQAEGLGHVRICSETMGKVNQLGTLEEVLEMCKVSENMLPCIDFGHINARTHGGLTCAEDFEHIFETVKNQIGESRLKEYHSHFSQIEYTAGGEKRHLTFADTEYGPDYYLMIVRC